MRSKRELIEKFIEQHMPTVKYSQSVAGAFSKFWSQEKLSALSEICELEKMEPTAFQEMIEQYNFTGKKPLQGEIVDAMIEKPKILERKSLVKRISSKLLEFVATFDEGIGEF